MEQIPLFPLNTVLFPSTPIQLHIFEKRYLQMMELCLDGSRQFGVVLIKNGIEANGPLAEPYGIGVTARIAKVDKQSDGSLDLVAVGQDRFRIVSLDYVSQPYLQGKVELFPIQTPTAPRLAQSQLQLGELLRSYLQILLKAGAIQIGLQELPEDVMVLAYLATAIVQIEPYQKQRILEIEQGDQMLDEIIALYRREVALLRAITSSPKSSASGSFSQN